MSCIRRDIQLKDNQYDIQHINPFNEVNQKDAISRILWYSDWLPNTTSAGNSIFVTIHNTTSGGRSIMTTVEYEKWYYEPYVLMNMIPCWTRHLQYSSHTQVSCIKTHALISSFRLSCCTPIINPHMFLPIINPHMFSRVQLPPSRYVAFTRCLNPILVNFLEMNAI